MPTITVPDADSMAAVPADPSPRGFAWWRVLEDGTLESYPDVAWVPGWNSASCGLYPRFFRARWRRLHPAGVPGSFCLCGFHGSNLPQPAGPGPRMAARIHSGRDQMVFGSIEAAGQIVRDRRGFRAGAARPLALYVAAEHLSDANGGGDRISRAAARYGLPLLRSFDAFVDLWGPARDADVTSCSRTA